MTTGSRSRPLGRLAGGEPGSVPSGRGAPASGRLGSLGDGVQPSDASAGPSAQQQPPARRLTPAERFKPKPQPRSTRRASTEPKADPEPPATRATRSGRGGGDDAPAPSGRRGNGTATAVKADPEPMAVDAPAAAAAARRTPAQPRRPPPPSDSSSNEDGERGPVILSQSARLRADVSADFPYAARLARRAPPPLDLVPPPSADGAPPSPRHFPLSAFGTGADGGLTLLQLPARLPASATDRTPPPAGGEPGGVQGCASLADLAPGVIGRVLVMASGDVKVHIGDVEYALVPGMPVDSLAAGVRLDLSGGGRSAGGGGQSARRTPSATSASVGRVVNRATLVPDVVRLLAGGAAPEYRRAAGFKGPRALDAEWAAAGAALASPGGPRRAVVASDDEGGGAPARQTGREARVVMDDDSE